MTNVRGQREFLQHATETVENMELQNLSWRYGLGGDFYFGYGRRHHQSARFYAGASFYMGQM